MKQTKEKKDFISGAFKTEGISDDYGATLAHLTAKKVKVKVEAEVGDLVLLVTKRGHQNIKSHVGKVVEVNENDYSFQMTVDGQPQKVKLPYSSLLAKSGLVTVGFYTIK